ncbi:MAG: peptidase [Planctomycetes bacterium]|nr:peptidase [Planctomycetota bacterium]
MNLNIIFVIILLGGWCFGKLAEKLKLPAVLGMVILGICCSVVFKTNTPQTLWDTAGFLRSLALIVILLRAGLGISKAALKKASLTAILMGFCPCIIEAGALTFAFHYVFQFDYITSAITAFLLAAVSLAVVVPTMLELKDEGYGRKKNVPTVVLAGTSLDNVLAITCFSIFLSLAVTGRINVAKAALGIPLSITVGILSGIIAGLVLTHYFKKHHENFRATEKTLVLLACAALLVDIGEKYHFAALLSIMTIGFILLEKAEPIAHELSRKFAKIWIFAEIILFVLIGYSVDIGTVCSVGLKGLAVISIGLIFRSFGVLIATAFSGFTLKQRLFCVIAYLPKATVQAALGGLALSKGLPNGEAILAIAVLSIIFTAPLGLIGIRLFGKKLLDLDVPQQ